MIDAHQHFWQLSRGDYDWLKQEKSILQQDYLPKHLRPLLKETGIYKSILVQAAETDAETDYILSLYQEYDFIAGIVAWLDFDAPDNQNRLSWLCQQEGLVGIRPVLQGIPETDWILAPHRISLLQQLAQNGKCFDALIQPRHLPVIEELISWIPEISLVIDHGAKPFIANKILSPWQEDLSTLADFPNIYCKLSGLITEAAPGAEWSDLRPYIDILLNHFGPDRLMWGSDWPVLNNEKDYLGWFHFCYDYIAQQLPDACSRIFGQNAARFYKIEDIAC